MLISYNTHTLPDDVPTLSNAYRAFRGREGGREGDGANDGSQRDHEGSRSALHESIAGHQRPLASQLTDAAKHRRTKTTVAAGERKRGGGEMRKGRTHTKTYVPRRGAETPHAPVYNVS